MTKPQAPTLLPWLTRNWAIVAFIGSIVYQLWSGSLTAPIKEQVVNTRLSNLEATYVTQKDLAAAVDRVNDRLADIQSNVAKLAK